MRCRVGRAAFAASSLLVIIALAVLPVAGSAAGPGAIDVPEIVARVLPAVVSITTRHVREAAANVLSRGLGSGVIIDRQGRIVTNYHVIKDATDIKVTLPDGRTFTARLVGADPVTDLALLQIDGPRLPVALLAETAAALRVGEPVVAIGNPLWIEGGPSVTAGVVSGLDRVLEQPGLPTLHHLIQTDAAINEGNSGGPLVNRAGKVIGINTARIASAHGIGFAIPVATVRVVVGQLVDRGVIVRPTIAAVAISVNPQVAFGNALKAERGVLITAVTPGGPADVAGLRVGDVITSFAAQPIRDLHDFHAALWRRRPGETVTMNVDRDGTALAMRVTLVADRRVEVPTSGS